MSDHFAAFSFVDRITEFAPGAHARGWYAVPRDIAEFPSCLVAEAVGQLAAWIAMDKLAYRGRPVAALATETLFEGSVAPGDLLELDVGIDDCDDDVIAYGGWAKVNGKRVIELRHCLGPMLPVEELDSPDALRERFAVLRGRGAAAGSFRGVAPVPLTVDARVPGKSLHATLMVPEHAAFFGDHFPRRPVFPATLLLDLQMRLAIELANSLGGSRGAAAMAPSRMTNVKMRSFITPGQQVGINVELLPASDDAATARIALSAHVGDRAVATARVELVDRVLA
jgi:3-hydroxymyristoyl/3-hydroxydecanoyl-(acyl carrier protein) dehydratase